MRVLYFTVVPLITNENGGSICCRNHVIRLAADPGIELFGMVAGQPEWKDGTDAFFANLGVPHHFQPFRDGLIHHRGIANIPSFVATMVFQFPWEVRALNQFHIQEGVDWAIRHYSIDVLLIDYHPSAMFLRLPRTDVRTVLIGLGREGDFYRDQIRLRQTHHGRLTAPISLHRARRFERRTNASVDKVVTIGLSDLPRHKVRSQPVCITPYLDPKPQQWSYSGTSSAFFVGDINHYPNRLAIEWITRRLAPALLELGSSIRIRIVGAAETDIEKKDRHANVNFLGRAGADVVSTLFQTADLMICPIQNDYGVKFKAVEALSYGTPLFASPQTLLGLPQLRGMPTFDLEHPADAAKTLCNLIGQPEQLRAVSRSQQQQQANFIATQHDVWSRTLNTIEQRGLFLSKFRLRGRGWRRKSFRILASTRDRIRRSIPMLEFRPK